MQKLEVLSTVMLQPLVTVLQQNIPEQEKQFQSQEITPQPIRDVLAFLASCTGEDVKVARESIIVGTKKLIESREKSAQ